MHIRRGRWLFLGVLVCGLALFTAAWYVNEANKSRTSSASASRYVEGVPGAPVRINPLAPGSDTDRALVALIFAGLTKLDQFGQPQADLAESWTVSQDGRVYTFLLRSGLSWPDSVSLTSRDALFTLALLQSSELTGQIPIASSLPAWVLREIDARTFTIELEQPFAPLPAYLSVGLLPEHLLRNLPPAQVLSSPFNQRPIGAGPYRLSEINSEHAVLQANRLYHTGTPAIQNLELRFFADEGELFSALLNRQIDGALFSELSENQLQQLRKARLLFLSLPTSQVGFVHLNLSKAVFQDRRVRQALLYAIDRDALIAELVPAAQPSLSPIMAGVWASGDQLSRYDQDLSAAALLLDEAGWRLSGNIRRKDGAELAFDLRTTNDPRRLQLAQALAQRWSALGIRVNVVATGSTILIRDALPIRDFDAVLLAGSQGQDPDPFRFWHSSAGSGAAANVGGLADPRFDRLLEAGRTQVSIAARKDIYAAFQELFAQELPALPLFSITRVYAQSSTMRNVKAGFLADDGGRFWQVQQWQLKR